MQITLFVCSSVVFLVYTKSSDFRYRHKMIVIETQKRNTQLRYQTGCKQVDQTFFYNLCSTLRIYENSEDINL